MRTVTMLGEEIDRLPLASLESVTWTKNQPDGYTGFFPKYAYDKATVPVLGTSVRVVELQIWTTTDEGDLDQLLTWGPILDIQSAGSDDAMHFTGASVDWYLFSGKRYIDGQRPDFLTNPSFESGGGSLGGWIDGGDVTSSVTTDWAIDGTHSARLVASHGGADEHLHQANDVTAGPLGLLLTVRAWYQIESFTAAAYGSRGLFVQGIEGSTIRASNGVAIDENTPVGVAQRAETTIWIPPNKTWTIDVRGYALNSILWDDFDVVAMDSIGTNGAEEDIAHLCRIIILFLQNLTVDVGKSNVYIVPPADGDTVGVTEAKQWQWADHTPADGQLHEWTERSDGIDYYMAYDADAGTRTFVPARPKGTDRTGDVLLAFPGNVADYRWRCDGTATVTTSTFLGDGDGPDREEGFYSDASAIGGLTLEQVTQAPSGAGVASLQPLAQGQVALLHDPPRVIDVDIRPDAVGLDTGAFAGIALLKVLMTGDSVPLTIDNGYVQESSLWQIAQLVFTCATGVLTATLNEVGS